MVFPNVGCQHGIHAPLQICVWIFTSSIWRWCWCSISHQYLLIYSKGTTFIWYFGFTVAVGLFTSLSFSSQIFFFKFLWLPSHFTKWFYHQMVNSNGNVFKENNLSLPLGKVCFYTTCIFSISLEMRIVYYKCIIFFFQNMSAWLDFEWVSK